MKILNPIKRHRKKSVAVAAGLLLMGTGVAVASNIAVTAGSIGGGQATISSCQTGTLNTTLEDVTYDAAVPGYVADEVWVTNVTDPACVGETLSVTVADASNVALANGSVTITGTPEIVVLSGNVSIDEATEIFVAITP